MTSFDIVDESDSKDRVVPRRHGTRKTPATGKSGTSAPKVGSGRVVVDNITDSESSTEKSESGLESTTQITVDAGVTVDAGATVDGQGKAVDAGATVDEKGKTVDRRLNDEPRDPADDVAPNDKGAGSVVEAVTEKAAAGDTEHAPTSLTGVNATDASAPKVASVPDTEPSHEIIKFDWIPDPVMKRLLAAVVWQKPLRAVYTLSSIDPAATTFGNYKETLLCYKGKPLTVSFVGRIMSTFFKLQNGSPARCASVTFKFMRECDDHVCRAVLYGKARPPEVDPRKTFWAGSKQTMRDKKTKISEIRNFEEVYDGSGKVTNTRNMPKLENSELAYNDLVLMECQIHRYTPDGEWYVGPTWTTRLRLVRVVRLFKGPPDVPRDPVEVIESPPVVAEEEPQSDDDDMGF